MSMQATFVDSASSIDPTNFASNPTGISNTFISYYTYGAAIALALDLSMRSEFDDLNLDALMQYMWQSYGKDEKAYSSNDIRAALASVTGSESFAAQFFERYIDDSQLPDFEALLAKAGMVMRKANSGAAWAGPVTFAFDDDEAIIGTNSIIGTPLYEAGLDRGDRVVAVGGRRIDSQRDWDRAIERADPGDTATIRYLQRGIKLTADIVFVEDPALEVAPLETLAYDPSPAQLAFRSAWLGDDQ
jgi:predicted metalloprotease with PDZ domain